MTKDEALAQQEFVGRFAKFTDGIWREVTDGSAGVPLYTNPPQPDIPPYAWVTFTPYGDEDDVWYENPEGQLLEGWTYKPLYDTTPPQPTSGDYALGYAEGFNDACKKLQQEPVAWMHNFIEGGISIGKRPADLERHPDRWTALFKDPKPCPTCEALARTVMLDQTSHDAGRTWVGLTDEEAVDCWPGLAMYADCAKFWENIEAKLKEKNT